MRWRQTLGWTLRSLLAFAAAVAVVCAVNLGGSAVATLAGAPAGGSPRLAWDMICVMISMVLATAVLVRTALGAQRIHAFVFAALALLTEMLGVLQLGADWPLWFSSGIVLTLPLQVVAGARLADLRRARHRADVR